ERLRPHQHDRRFAVRAHGRELGATEVRHLGDETAILGGHVGRVRDEPFAQARRQTAGDVARVGREGEEDEVGRLFLVERSQGIGCRLGDEIVESFVFVDMHDLGAVLAKLRCRRLGAGAQCDRIDIAQLARLGHQLERGRLQLAAAQLRVHPDLRHQTTFAWARTWMMRSTAVPSSSMIAPALRASASEMPSMVSPGSPRSIPRSPRPTCLISLERAAMMPFSDAYRGSAMPAVTVISAGVEDSTTW